MPTLNYAAGTCDTPDTNNLDAEHVYVQPVTVNSEPSQVEHKDASGEVAESHGRCFPHAFVYSRYGRLEIIFSRHLGEMVYQLLD